jgi:glycosyltransferase involved in cell wall biosynthesis
MTRRFKNGLRRNALFLAVSPSRFLRWLLNSESPAAVSMRETIRGNGVLIGAARGFMRSVRALSRLQRRLRDKFKSREERRLDAIMAARMVGGSLTTEELEQIWHRCRRADRVLVVADGPEREQIGIILKSTRVRNTRKSRAGEAGTLDPDGFNLIVIGPGEEIESLAPRLVADAAEKVLNVGCVGKRSAYMSLARRYSPVNEQKSVRDKIAGGDTLRVVCLNDVGFRYGAGIALKRQTASFLLSGFEVHVVAWAPGEDDNMPSVTGIRDFEGWRGVRNVGGELRREQDSSRMVERLLAILRAIDPDVIVTGNLHSTKFPLELAKRLKELDALVISYMHDCFWATGRCAYPVLCNLYLTGCNETCPTAEEYPRLPAEKIGPAWHIKSRIFEGKTGIPLAVNSEWTKTVAVQRFGSRARVDTVPLAVDHELFSPMPKAVARRLLGLPEERAFVVMGAVDVLNKWKGGELFRQLLERLQARGDASILLFGQSSTLFGSTKPFGLVEDERMMPFILNAADIFVGTATEEAFGQTLLEASACGLPVVAFDRGGISDIVINGETGVLVKNLDVNELHEAVRQLLADAPRCQRLGQNARLRVEARFTLAKQSSVWLDYLKDLSNSRSSHEAA